jgi:hypothetical protein
MPSLFRQGEKEYAKDKAKKKITGRSTLDEVSK